MSRMALPIALYSAAQVRALDADAIEQAGHPRLHADEAGRRGGAALPAHALADGASHRDRVRQRQQRRRRLRAGALRAGRGPHRVGAGGRTPERLEGDARQACAGLPCGRRRSARLRRDAAARAATSSSMRCSAPGCRGRCVAELLRGHPRDQRERQAGVRPRRALGARRRHRRARAARRCARTATVTFVGLKTGLFVGDGPEFAGTVFFDDLEARPAPPSAVPAAPDAHHRDRDPRGAAAPAAHGQQGRLRTRADRRQRQRHAGGSAPRGRGLPARRRRADHRRRSAGERGARSPPDGPSSSAWHHGGRGARPGRSSAPT